MANEGLEGITEGTPSTPISEEEKEEVLREALSEISGIDDVGALLDALDVQDEREILEGIEVEEPEQERDVIRARSLQLQITEQQTQNILEEQLSQLQGIDDDVELLQRIAANTATTNQRLDSVLTQLRLLNDRTQRENALRPKDEDVRTIQNSNSSQDVVTDENISSSFILVKASSENNGSLFFGSEGVGLENGFELEPGEDQMFPIDIVLESFQVISERDNEEYSYLTFGVEEA